MLTSAAKHGDLIRHCAANALREYLHGDYLLLYAAMEATDTVYVLSIRHHRQLTFDFSAYWPR